MIVKILLIIAASIAASQVAVAADRSGRSEAIPYLSAYNWTGVYLGGNVGSGRGRLSDDTGGINVSGLSGGAQLGFNWQAGHVVFGLETDFQLSGQNATQNGLIGVIPVSVSEKILLFGTGRGRVGFAWDRMLLYLTGGLAYTGTQASLAVGGLSTSAYDANYGWTIGTGIEYAFVDSWSAKIEYLYIDTNPQSITLAGITDNIRVRDNIVRAGLNHRF